MLLQVTPCGLGDIVNASTNFTTQKEQEDRLTLLSELTDATMRAHVLKDSAAASFLLKELPHNPFVQTAQFSLTLPDNSEKT